MKANLRTPYSLFYFKNGFKKFSKPKSAFLYTKKYSLNLLTSEKKTHQISKLFDQLKKIKVHKNFKNPTVIHLFYELGFELLECPFLKDDTPLAIVIEYQEVSKIKLSGKKIDLLKSKDSSLNNYEKAFNIGYEQLLLGNCYQFNYTEEFKFGLPNEITAEDLEASLWRDPLTIGAFAHSTYIPHLNKLFLSNSPEGLFQLKKNKTSLEIFSMPIKGSIKTSGNDKIDRKKLLSSKKDEGELNMITDLLRNDLSKIENPNARVIKKKQILKVPGIIHQYSIISAQLTKKVNLFDIIKGLFPGGSITGAPKKNVLKILHGLEKRERGFYTGSTILCFENGLSSSINIRSAECDFNKKILTCSAGGGITLLSKMKHEKEEMHLKRNSFIGLFY